MANWNPWHGCIKYSEGCENCYVYRGDERYERDASETHKTGAFYLPIKKDRKGEYKLKRDGGIVYTCFTSDFFIDKADEWRSECWQMIKERSDLTFLIITKRIVRAEKLFPADWGSGYDNVVLCVTVESQKQADIRLPVYMNLPIKHRCICCEPLLGEIDLSPYLNESISQVVAGGESGNEARVCRYDWVMSLREQCVKANVPFYFKQTGTKFLKDEVLYRIKRADQHSQARKAGIDFLC